MKPAILPGHWFCKAASAAAVAAVLGLSPAFAQENFSANKTPAQLFASDCTGAGCHKGPQGLGKSVGLGGLSGFLREHYTNSRESAAALANYLSGLPSGPAAREARTPPVAAPAAKPAAKPAAVAPADGIIAIEPKPTPSETRAARQHPAARTSRAAVRPDEEPSATNPVPPALIPSAGEQAEPAAKPETPAAAKLEPPVPPLVPAPARVEPPARPAPVTRAAQRGRQPSAAAAAAAAEALPPAEPAAAPPPPAAKQFDIFD